MLDPQPGNPYIDATLGRAGHALRILQLTDPGGRLLAIDADPESVDSARVSLAPFAGRVILVCDYFDRLPTIAEEHGFEQVGGVLFDLGVSSPQLDNRDRGFSFQDAGPLDMRMNPQVGEPAAALLASSSQDELARIFKEYGEERYARRIARRLMSERSRRPIETTTQLASIVSSVLPPQRQPIHPATRVFQALRIAVNDELNRLKRALPGALSVLGTGGRLVVISFHSLEDRIVKQFMQSEARGCVCPPDIPQCICGHNPRLKILTRKPIRASEEEQHRNPRSRSAKLRAAEAL